MWDRKGLTALGVAVVWAVCGANAAIAAPEAVPGKVAVRYLETPPGQKPRVVITADPELDDSNSLIRYLLYSGDFRTEGLIYASSQFHWKGDGQGTKLSVPGREYTRVGRAICPCTSWRWNPDDRFIDDAVDAYAKAYPNLRAHDRAYPSPTTLRSKIRWGNVEFDGEMSKDTPGSNLIKALLLDQEETPIYLHAWGGQSTIARALKSIEDQYKDTPRWAAIRAKVIGKAVIHPSGDQDDTYANYIKPHWPEIRYREAEGAVPLGYFAQRTVSLDDAVYLGADWTRTNITDRGPLGALYRVWGDGKPMVKGDLFDYFAISGKTAQELKQEGYVVWSPIGQKGSFIAEGDTPTFINLIDNGLLGYRGDSLGGWGGYPKRAEAAAGGLANISELASNTAKIGERPRAPTHPFLAPMQRDFAARLIWAVTPRYVDANHSPRVQVKGARRLQARPGQQITSSVVVSDPDHNQVRVRWRAWPEAGSYSGQVRLDAADGDTVSFHVPSDAKPGETFHVLAEATDDGAPALTRYAHLVVTVVQ